MANIISRISVRNFRSIANADVQTGALNVLFGPNGAGKSTFLDTIWLIRDCAINGVEIASSRRNHGIGMLWDAAEEGSNISVKLETEMFEYEVLFGISSGRIEPFVGERFLSKKMNICLIDRKIGSDKADFYHYNVGGSVSVTIREPEKLAFSRYVAFEDQSQEAFVLDKILRHVHSYSSRSLNLYRLRSQGSESGYQMVLSRGCENLWSVLRNLRDRSVFDNRYHTIIEFMRKSFPDFHDLYIEQTGPNTVYGSFIEKNLRRPIQASGVSDGHLQMLIHLTALFTEGDDRDSLLLFDEPETSLHPYTIAILAEAMKIAAKEWNKQVFVATHSPVLISQFDPENIVAAQINDVGQTVFQRVSDMEEIRDLLEEYATGSLYMAEMIAAQSKPSAE